MHQEIGHSGEIVRETLVIGKDKHDLETKLARLREEAASNPLVASVIQRRIKRISPCPCGSGKLFKKCCWPNYEIV